MCVKLLQWCRTLRHYGLQPASLLLSIGFPKVEYRNELPCLHPGDLPNPRIKLSVSFVSCTGSRVLHRQRYRVSPSTRYQFSSVQLISVAQSRLTLCDPMNRSTPGLPVHHQLPELTQTHVHQVVDAIQPSHPLSSASPPAPNASQHQGLFQ